MLTSTSAVTPATRPVSVNIDSEMRVRIERLAGTRRYEVQQTAKIEALRQSVAVGLSSGPDISENEVFDELEVKFLAMAERAR